MHSGNARRMLGLVALVGGCGEDGWQRTEQQDAGILCLKSMDDGSLGLRVRVRGCLSSSCDRLIEHTCSASSDGAQVVVTSRTVLESKSGECTDDCGLSYAKCDTAPIASGTYELVYGNQVTTVELPADTRLAFPGDGVDQSTEMTGCGF